MTTTGALRIAVPGQKHDRARGGEDRPGGDRGGKGGRRWTHRVVDLRGLGGKVRTLHYPAGDLVVVSGLPGSGKSTMMRRVTAGARSPAARPPGAGNAGNAGNTGNTGNKARRIDSQDTRDRFAHRMPSWLPYAVYRPLVRIAHYWGLKRALDEGGSLVVHDCGSMVWVRRWLARRARRAGRGLHLLLLDVPAGTALQGQRARGRRVSAYAFARHRRAARRLVEAAQAPYREAPAGRRRRSVIPRGCVSVVIVDRAVASSLEALHFP
ncbi:ATP-binding protein [Streptomyces sp. NPDC059637]|uniref:ATP-binding protein n=1 Tax=Streptomyces sp. NPDC059637 TaxID=3347752 RepID=UPI00368A6979